MKPDGSINAVDYNVTNTYSSGKLLTVTLVPFKRFDFNIADIMAGIPGIINSMPTAKCPDCPSCPDCKACPDCPTCPDSNVTPIVSDYSTVWDGSDSGTPALMKAQGWNGSSNQLLYALFSTYGSHDWGYKGDDQEDTTAKNLHDASTAIKTWFTGRVKAIGTYLLANPTKSTTLINNDANDKGGLYMVDNIKTQLTGMGLDSSRWTEGTVYNP